MAGLITEVDCMYEGLGGAIMHVPNPKEKPESTIAAQETKGGGSLKPIPSELSAAKVRMPEFSMISPMGMMAERGRERVRHHRVGPRGM